MKEHSIWLETKIDRTFKTIQNNLKTKVLINGGGITGILCAYELNKRGIDYILVEKDRIGRGITKKTTAFISFNHDYLYQDMLKEIGYEKTKEYLDLNKQAIEYYKELDKIYDIEFKECSHILYSRISKEKIILEQEALRTLGIETNKVESIPINQSIEYGIEVKNQATINPFKCINKLSKELNIYEKSEILKVRNNIAYLKNNKIEFEKLIITTHYPILNKFGLYFMKLTQRRSYVAAIKYPNITNMYTSIDKDGLYFRPYNEYLIIGGNDRDTKNFCYQNFKEKIKDIFIDKEIEYIWSNQDCVTIDNLPYIGQFDILHKNWYVGTGFNLWGFTPSVITAKLLSDAVEEKAITNLFNPNRNMFKKGLLKNISTSLKNQLILKTPRCTHLGCALNYNEIDNVYECPCHGSRYTKDGKLLDGPAKKDL